MSRALGMTEVNQFDRVHTHTLERWNEITQHLYWTCFLPTPGEAQTSSSVNFMFSLVSIRESHYRYVFFYYGIASLDVCIGCNDHISSHKREWTLFAQRGEMSSALSNELLIKILTKRVIFCSFIRNTSSYTLDILNWRKLFWCCFWFIFSNKIV